MRTAKFLLPLVAALVVAACARQQPAYYVMDPQTGQQVPVVQQYSGPQQYVQAQATPQQYAPTQYQAPAQPSGARGFFNPAQPSYAQPQYAPAPQSPGRGLFGGGAAQPQYAPPPAQSYTLQYQPP